MVVKHVVTGQMPRAYVTHTLTEPDLEQNVRTCVSFDVLALSQEIIGRRGCFTAVVKKKPPVLASP